MKNKEIRRMVKQANLYYWQVAEEVGITNTTLCVWLRKELEGERLQRVLQAIEKLIKERGDNGENCKTLG